MVATPWSTLTGLCNESVSRLEVSQHKSLRRSSSYYGLTKAPFNLRPHSKAKHRFTNNYTVRPTTSMALTPDS